MISLTLVLLLGLVNLVAMQYGQGAIRTALDEGARYGAFLGNTVVECENRAEAVLHGDAGLLRGSLGDTIAVRCEIDGDLMRAVATGSFDWWLGGLPDVDIRMVGEAVIEAPP
jgi:hypothetical protein